VPVLNAYGVAPLPATSLPTARRRDAEEGLLFEGESDTCLI